MTATNASGKNMTEQGRARKSDILDTAATLFDERGYHNVSMDDIAAAAGLGKATLYHYFQGKTEILYEIHRQFIYPLLERERERSRSGISATDELRAIARDVIGFFSQRRGHMRVFSENLRDLEPEHSARVRAHRDEYRRHIEHAFVRGNAAGEFDVDDVRIAALTFLGAVNWAYQWFSTDGPMSAEEAADAIWSQLRVGLVTNEADSTRVGRHE